MPTVSVVVPTWNGVHLIPACLDSIRVQTFRDVEVIVADDGSTDRSVEMIRKNYPEAQLVCLPRNLGFCLAANAGIRASRGELIALLNNDTELAPECLSELVAAIRADPGLGICAPKMVYYDDPTLINSAGHACRPDGVVVDIGRRQPDSDWYNRPREVLGACAGAALYRRRMLEQIGLFDPDFCMSYEDADLNWRAQWAGWRAQYVPTAVLKHREGVSREIRSRRAIFLGMRNSMNVFVKDWPLRALLQRLPQIWRGWRAAAMSLTRRGHARVLPAVVWAVLWQMPRMLARRRRIRTSRRVPVTRFEELLALGARHARTPPEE